MVIYVKNKRKVIRPSLISTDTESKFEAIHKGYTIRIDQQKPGNGSKWYAWVTHPDGTYIVDGYFDYPDIRQVIENCMKNIYWTPKRSINYVRQGELYGCAIACIAMILNKSYREIRSMFPPERGFGDRNGMTSHDYISFMFTWGYIGMTVHACESHTQRKREPNEWIHPLSEINIVSTITEHGPHAVLWINGIVYDPNKEGFFSIEDYNVQGITGFWKLSDFKV